MKTLVLGLGNPLLSDDSVGLRVARALEGKIALTTNEWLMAHRLGNEYWLYVVVNVAKVPELYTIQNPAEKLKPEEEIEVVRYIVTNWKGVAIKEKVVNNEN